MLSNSERYIKVKQLFDENVEKILEDSKSSEYFNTLKMLFNTQRKVDELISSIELLANNQYPYAINAIMRILYEHYIVAHYVWLKARIEKNDDCAKEFYTTYKLGEALKRTGYDLDIEGIKEGIEKNNSPENLKKITSKFNISEAQIQEGYKVKNQFEVKNILKFILKCVNENDPFKEVHQHFPFYLQQYSFLSSYVHCGPSAEDDVYNLPDKIFIQRTLKESLEHAKIVSETIKLHIMFMLLEKNNFYGWLLKPIMEIKKITRG